MAKTQELCSGLEKAFWLCIERGMIPLSGRKHGNGRAHSDISADAPPASPAHLPHSRSYHPLPPHVTSLFFFASQTLRETSAAAAAAVALLQLPMPEIASSYREAESGRLRRTCAELFQRTYEEGPANENTNLSEAIQSGIVFNT